MDGQFGYTGFSRTPLLDANTPVPRKRGPKPLSDKKKRVPIHGRVMPSTASFLRKTREPNDGRAVDKVVGLYRKLLKQVAQG
jgi:hypothetical protein